MFNPTRREALQSLTSILAASIIDLCPQLAQAKSKEEEEKMTSTDVFLIQNARTQYPLPQGEPIIDTVRGGRDYGAIRYRHGRREKHNGIDLFVRQGTNVYPIIQGVVKSVSFETYAGKFVTIESLYPFRFKKSSPIEDAIIYTDYMHLQTQLVHHNQGATFNTVLGRVGKTGVNVSGPHLHLQMYTRRNGVKIFIDPRKALVSGSYFSLIKSRGEEELYNREFRRINDSLQYAKTTL